MSLTTLALVNRGLTILAMVWAAGPLIVWLTLLPSGRGMRRSVAFCRLGWIISAVLTTLSLVFTWAGVRLTGEFVTASTLVTADLTRLAITLLCLVARPWHGEFTPVRRALTAALALGMIATHVPESVMISSDVTPLKSIVVFLHLLSWTVLSGAVNPLRWELRADEPDPFGDKVVQRLVDWLFVGTGGVLITLALDYGVTSTRPELPYMRLPIAMAIATAFLGALVVHTLARVRRIQRVHRDQAAAQPPSARHT